MCSVINPALGPQQRVTVQLQPPRSEVSEAEIQEMFEYAAEDVADISDNWDETMEVVRKTEQVFPLSKPSEEDLLQIRASQPTMTLTSLWSPGDWGTSV